MTALETMKAHYLTPLFRPRNIVVIGASETAGSCGRQVFSNLLEAPFAGRVLGINLRHTTVFDQPVYRNPAALPAGEIDLAILTTPSKTLCALVKACGERGIRALLVLSPDWTFHDTTQHAWLSEATATARGYGMRLLGPTHLGLLHPAQGLLAAHYQGRVKPGALALVSQSSSVANALLDWADAHDLGFSTVISLGTAADVTFGEVLDYLSQDPETHGILVYLEDTGESRHFLSALRMAARSKPVAVMKIGRHADTAARLPARTHAECLTGRDEVFDAALRRVGVLRLQSTAQAATAARMMAADFRATGRRLAIIANGYSAGRMAADRATDLNLELPRLATATQDALRTRLPHISADDNPLDILGQASPADFVAATQVCLADPNVDGVLVILSPQAGTDHLQTAQGMIELRARSPKMLLLVWLGDKKIATSRALLDQARMACFFSPEEAVEAFAGLAGYAYNQLLSRQTPGPLASRTEPDITRARQVIASALAAGRSTLHLPEVLAVLDAFHIPFAQTRQAATPEAAQAAAQHLGWPVALKIDAPQVLHKTDIDGVALNLRSPEELLAASQQLQAAALAQGLSGSETGFLVQKMHGKPQGRELMIGLSRDRVFGPVISFGAGGITVEVFEDIAVALPPLNPMLVDSLIRRTRISKALGAFRNLPPVDMQALRDLLLRVSEMACELPELQELDLNPVIADASGVLAIDATLIVAPLPPGFRRYGHMAIHPYPSHLEKPCTLRDGQTCTLRPIRPEDADALQRLVSESMSEQSRFNRFLSTLRQLSPAMLARFTQLDYARELALVMTGHTGAPEALLGVARYSINPDAASCEFAIAVADSWHGQGVGWQLMEALFAAAREAGMSSMEGEVLASNTPMLGLMKKLGFEIHPHPEESSLKWVVRRREPAS